MLSYYAGDNIWLALLLSVGVVCTVFLAAVSVFAMFAIWWERKVAGHAQSRVGPMHTGRWHGWAQSLADGIKLVLKEDIIPARADKWLFKIAPYLTFVPVFVALLALPFGPQLVFETGLQIGVLYLLAVLAMEVMGTIIAGWSSNNKWSIYGAMREACQMVSYEIPLGLAILTGVVVAGTLNLVELGYLQGAGMHDWFVFHNPFIFGVFLVYFIASLASNKRAPFDLPESESELVAGFLTEYSGIRWALFFFGEYTAMFVIGAIQAALFMGGWNSPLGGWDPVYLAIGYDPVAAGQAYFSGAIDAGTQAGGLDGAAAAMGLSVTGLIILNIYSAMLFAAKAVFVVWVQIWLRWTLPRIRIDQVLHTCVKVLLPAGLVALVGAAAWVWLVDSREAVTIALADGGEATFARLAHLTGDDTTLQAVTQWVLTVIGLVVAGAMLLVMAGGWLGVVRRAKNQPPKSLFADVMPVGRDVTFGKE